MKMLKARHLKEIIMSNVLKVFKDFMDDEEGLTLIEYLIGAALIVLALLAARPWDQLGTALNEVISKAYIE